MEISSFKTKYPDVATINIKKFIMIFNRGLAAGILARSHLSAQGKAGNSELDATQRQLENVFNADNHKVMAMWDDDAALRAEWQNNFDAFLGFVELDLSGHMRVTVRKT